MKNVAIIGGIAVLAFVGYMIGSRSSSQQGVVVNEMVQNAPSDNADERGEMIRGRVMDISEDKIIIGLYEERERSAVDRDKMESMSDSERQAMREEMRAAREEQGEPEIVSEKVIALNENTVYVKNTGFGGQGRTQDGEQPQGEEIQRDVIEEGMTVNIILAEGSQNAERVMLQTNQTR